MSDECYMRNEAKDGYMPCCSKCHKPFEDAEIGDVKNYPEDGRVSVFFKCNSCRDEGGADLESDFTYKPDLKDEFKVRDIKYIPRPKEDD
ncbi:MAG: hypothetical protein UT24_C0003G0057 [Candidatus Woesebacteria bacterium GW2011_GWB1_39_12]|uniref:Uncharacterized protein n=1 Tax=Candidatus Woesebacteria bacterium GW2011_GWB1_39_12 TaxID=1618574 RepID=A0A0G0PTZ2_9BACT|nr:MAG: hypothetical protein UT24_C0003G0057 [Candidatus Woesebacteria bacterium GW2011_GWB1_39_12]